MIRASAILLVILAAAVITIPTFPQQHFGSHSSVNNSGIASLGDPNATLAAFNYTYSQVNLFTNSSSARFPAANVTGTSFVWLSTVNKTSSNTKIPGTGFEFNVTKAGIAPSKQTVNYTLPAPQYNCKGCTGDTLSFNLFGSITKGTNASYQVTLAPPNSTINIPPPTGTQQSFTTLGSFPSSISSCPEDFCIPIPGKYVGYNLTLSFTFGWNATESPGMFASVGEILVSSTSNFIPSTVHYMQQDPSISSLIRHTSYLSQISYNNTLLTHLHPGNTNTTKLWWRTEVISFYYPFGYKIKSASLNTTQIYPGAVPEVAFESTPCVQGTRCSESLLALNISDTFSGAIAHNSTITIISTTSNTLSPLVTFSAGVQTQTFTPGDTITVKTVNSPSVTNATATQQRGNLTLTFSDHNGATHVLSGQAFPTLTILGGVYNLTLPSDCSGYNCGSWTISANFTSHYDLGLASASFRMDQMQLTSFSTSGGNLALAIQGSLIYSDNTAATTATTVVFAVDSETPTSIPVTTNNYTLNGPGLYATNVTLVNGIFTQGQSLIWLFTIVNSNRSYPAFNATVTIEHEWPGSPPQTHGMKANFTLGIGHLGDLSFTQGPQSYKAIFTITQNGPQLQITSLSTGTSESVPISGGSSPLSPTEPQAGLFNITISTNSHGRPVSTSSIQSAPYAYVYGLSLASSKYLAYSKPFIGSTLSLTLTSDKILGAKKLVVFALARDSSGIILSNNSQNPGFSDSTTLTANMDTIGEVAVSQQVTATLHLTSNSTRLTQIITVSLDLQNVGAIKNVTGVTIAPGATHTVTVTFNAPSSTGQYTLSFSSPQYDANIPLASQTLKVTILQSNLQILIPAAIGIVVAIIVLGVYLIKGQPEKKPEEEVTRKATGAKPKPSGSGGSSTKSLTQTQTPSK